MSLIAIILWAFIGVVMGVASIHLLPILGRRMFRAFIVWALSRK